MTPKEIILAAAELVSKPGAWTKQAYARDRTGQQSLMRNPDNSSWCASGALIRCAPPKLPNSPWENGPHARAFEILTHAVKAQKGYPSIVAWNDAPATTQDEVVEFIRKVASQLD